MNTAMKEGIKKLYHYQGSNLEYLKDTLIHNRVHCTRPESLNDPWDCRPYFDDLHLDDPAFREKWGSAFNATVAQLTPEQQADLRGAKTNWYENSKLLELAVKWQTRNIWKWIPEFQRIYCLTPQLQLLAMLLNLHAINPISRPSKYLRPVVFPHLPRLAEDHFSQKAGLSGRLSDSCAERIYLSILY